jgi:hypothetical protein
MQAEFPYARLIGECQRRTSADREFELLDTGLFDENRYFDIFIEYGKAGPEDICIRVEVCNRGPEAAEIHLLPHLWFRNNWARGAEPKAEPVIVAGVKTKKFISLVADDTQAVGLTSLLFHEYFHGDTGKSLGATHQTGWTALIASLIDEWRR